MKFDKDSTAGTLIIACLVCLVCSIAVAASAVGLKDLQEANALLDKNTNVLKIAGLVGDKETPTQEKVDTLFKNIEARIIDLKTGKELTAEQLKKANIENKLTYDQYAAAKTEEGSQKLPDGANIAKLKNMPKYAQIYVIKDAQERIDTYILPIHGAGLWKTMYGFIAIKNDAISVKALRYYQHGETPGLGGEVDNPKWRKLWESPTRQAYDAAGNVNISVTKSGMASDPSTQVDGLAGASLTTDGVNKMVRFWLGEHGFAPYLKNQQRKWGK